MKRQTQDKSLEHLTVMQPSEHSPSFTHPSSHPSFQHPSFTHPSIHHPFSHPSSHPFSHSSSLRRLPTPLISHEDKLCEGTIIDNDNFSSNNNLNKIPSPFCSYQSFNFQPQQQQIQQSPFKLNDNYCNNYLQPFNPTQPIGEYFNINW